MSRLKPPLAFPLSRLIQAGILALLLAGTFIPTNPARADEPSPLLPGGWRTFTTDNAPIAAGGVTKILEDSQGRVWIGTSDGISMYKNGAWQTFTEKDGLAAGSVNTLLEDRAGRVWVGTWDGVSVYASGAWQTFTEKNGLAVGDVKTILEDRVGRVWVGTSAGLSMRARQSSFPGC